MRVISNTDNQDYIDKMNYPDSSKFINPDERSSQWPRNGSTYHPIKGNPESNSVGVKTSKLDN